MVPCFIYFSDETTSPLGYGNTCLYYEGHFTHEPRAMTMRLWKPKLKCPNAVPRHFQHHGVWSWALKCSVKSYVTGSSTKCYFDDFLFTRAFRHNKIEWSNCCERSECHGLLVLCSAYLLGVVFETNPSHDHEPWSIGCHVGIHVDLTSILHSYAPLVPQA
jgi:hypothetical protein